MPATPFDSLQTFNSDSGPVGQFFSLPQLEKNGAGPVSRLPHSLRVVLESVLRNCDGEKITEDDVRDLANWQPNGKRVARAREVDLDRVIDHEIDGHERFDDARVFSETRHRGTH